MSNHARSVPTAVLRAKQLRGIKGEGLRPSPLRLTGTLLSICKRVPPLFLSVGLSFSALIALTEKSFAAPASPQTRKKAVASYLYENAAFGNSCGVLINNHKEKEALNLANLKLAANPNFAAAYAVRGWVFANYDEPEKALAEFDHALRLEPSGCYIVFQTRYRVYLDLGQPQKAIDDLTKAIAISPGAWHLYKERGQIYSILKKNDLAIADLTRANSLKPDEDLIYQRRGDCYMACGNYKKAIADYSAAIKLKPSELHYYALRADCYEKIGDLARAGADRKFYNNAVKDGL